MAELCPRRRRHSRRIRVELSPMSSLAALRGGVVPGHQRCCVDGRVSPRIHSRPRASHLTRRRSRQNRKLFLHGPLREGGYAKKSVHWATVGCRHEANRESVLGGSWVKSSQLCTRHFAARITTRLQGWAVRRKPEVAGLDIRERERLDQAACFELQVCPHSVERPREDPRRAARPVARAAGR